MKLIEKDIDFATTRRTHSLRNDEWKRTTMSFRRTDAGHGPGPLLREFSESIFKTNSDLLSASSSMTITRPISISGKQFNQHDFRRQKSSATFKSFNQGKFRRQSSSSLLLSNSSDFLSIPVKILPKSNNISRSSARVEEPEVNPYRILGLERNANFQEIHRAYLRLALLNHPHRKHSSNDDKSRKIRQWKFIVISASYETLQNRDHRTNYNFANKDQILKGINSNIKRNRGFWADVKSGLEISDKDERSLDHDGVQCCAPDSICYDWNDGAYRRDTRDDEPIEISPQKNNYVSIESSSLSSRRLLQNRADSENTTNTEFSADDYNNAGQNQLFGGVLRPLYKARNHDRFTESIELFGQVSGSNIFKLESAFKDKPETRKGFDLISQNWLISAPKANAKFSVSLGSSLLDDSLLDEDSLIMEEEDSASFLGGSSSVEDSRIYPSLPLLPKKVLIDLCSEIAPSIGSKTSIETNIVKETRDGILSEVTKKSRKVGDEYIVWTETKTKNLESGKSKISIKVQRQTSPVEAADDEEIESYLPSCFSHAFHELVNDASNFITSGFNLQRDDCSSLRETICSSDERRE